MSMLGCMQVRCTSQSQNTVAVGDVKGLEWLPPKHAQPLEGTCNDRKWFLHILCCFCTDNHLTLAGFMSTLAENIFLALVLWRAGTSHESICSHLAFLILVRENCPFTLHFAPVYI